MYQIANVYLLLLAGSIFTTLEEAINNPTSILQLISSALPSSSIFFLNFIITTWLAGVPLLLLQLGPTIIYYIYTIILYKPERLTRSMLRNGPFAVCEIEYGTVIPDILYVLCIVLLYWVISPIITIFACGFFMTTYIAYKYLYLYVAVRPYESGGEFFYGIYSYSMTALLTAVVLFTTYMGIKQGVWQAPLLLPLIAIIIYAWRYTEKQYKLLSLHMPFDAAVQADDAVSSTEAKDRHDVLLSSFNEEYLKQPNIVEPAKVYPYPHRINSVPLLTATGTLHEIYVDSIPIGVDPSVYTQTLLLEQDLQQQYSQQEHPAQYGSLQSSQPVTTNNTA